MKTFIFILLGLLLPLNFPAAYAQTMPEVYGPTQPQRPAGFIVLELFSTQACAFCPEADAMIKDFSTLEHVISFACHVDYFDVKSDPLAIDACGARQDMYEASLRAGPKYTPQMVLNGNYDVVGYKKADVLKTLERAARQPARILSVRPVSTFSAKNQRQEFEVSLPQMEGTPMDVYNIWFVMYDGAREILVNEGRFKGKQQTYFNTVTDLTLLGEWKVQPKILKFTVQKRQNSGGFAVIVQKQGENTIPMAAKYQFQ